MNQKKMRTGKREERREGLVTFEYHHIEKLVFFPIFPMKKYII